MRAITEYFGKLGSKVFNELLPAALVSGAVGLAFTQLHQPSQPQAAATASPASAEFVQMVHDEHQLVLDYVRKEDERQRIAADNATLRGSVVADSGRNTERNAGTNLHAALTRKGERKLAVADQKPVAEQVAAIKPAGEPLVLTNYVTPAPVPEKRRGVLTSTVHEIVSVAKKLPDWTRSAAETVLDLPGRILPSLPDRDFIKVSL